MHASTVARPGRYQDWSLDSIAFDAVRPAHLEQRPELLYLVGGASFVEIASDLYTRNLVEFFNGDTEVQTWLQSHWQHEEVQHGMALRRYVHAAWPDFDWDSAYAGFFADYSPLCKAELLGPTRAMELAARCVVETGTASYYTVLQRLSPEPVLRDLAGRIRADEIRHYKYFYHFFLAYAERERLSRRQTWRVLWDRLREVDTEDAFFAFKHMTAIRHPGQTFGADDYLALRRMLVAMAKPLYPYKMAAKMFLKPLALNHFLQRAAVPLLSVGAKYLLAS